MSHNDSLGYYASGTYGRRVHGGRLHFGSGRIGKYGLTFLQVRDDVESIDQLEKYTITENVSADPLTGDAVNDPITGDPVIILDTLIASTGASPKDNLMIGQDLAFYFWKRRIKLYGTAAISVVTDDISNGPLSIDELVDQGTISEEDAGAIPIELEDFENLIIFNSSSLPLPSPKGVLNSTVVDGGLSLNIPIGSAREKLEFKYQRIGANYKSLLNESLLGNKAGFQIKEELRLLNNKIFTSVKVSYFEDNLNELKPEATKTLSVMGMANLILNNEIPQVNFMISTTKDENNSPDSTGFDKDNTTQIWGLGTNYSREIGEVRNTFNMNYNNSAFSAYTSAMDSATTANSHMVNVGVASSFFNMIPLKTRVSYSNTYTDSEVRMKIANPALGASYLLLGDKLILNADTRFYHISSEDRTNESSRTLNRFEAVAGATYNIDDHHTVTFNTTGITSSNSELEGSSQDYKLRLYYEYRF